jgi:FG-GAP repeat protein
MRIKSLLFFLFLLYLAVFFISSCAGSSDGSSGSSYTVGGTVGGLSGTLVLQNNAGDDLTITADGAFAFATAIADGEAYTATVSSQPAGQTCSLADSSGTISGANITDIAVTCSASSYSVGGTVTGLSGTLVLQNNAGDDLSITADGSFTFATAVADGAAYAVTVRSQPTGQTCSLASSTGTISSADVTDVIVTCSASSFSVGGTITGLSGSLVLQNNAGDDLTITADGSFTFATEVANGATYTVTISTQPSLQTCSLSNDSGTISGADITDVSVSCPNVNWSQDAYLKASNNDASDSFGTSIGISGDLIVVGANGEDSPLKTVENTDGSADSSDGSLGSGGAYLYKEDGSGNWIQDAYLKASNNNSGKQFGRLVAISGDIVVISGQNEASGFSGVENFDGSADTSDSSNDNSESGAAYIFKKDGSNDWIQDAYLKASNNDVNDHFGISIAVDGDTVVVGANSESSLSVGVDNTDGVASTNNESSNAGAVYIFQKDGSDNWIQTAYLKASNSEVDDYFGISVAIDGDTVVVGASGEDGYHNGIINTDDSVDEGTGAGGQSGAVYIFKRDGSGIWSQDAYLKASNNTGGDNFGYSVGIDGDSVAVGAYYEDSGATTIVNTDASHDEGTSANYNSGAVYVFKRDGVGDWSQDAYIKTSNSEGSDSFGYLLRVNGDTIVAGVQLDKSAANTIENRNGEASANNDNTASGAAYVFKKDSSGNWYQDAYLKASNSEGGDTFGSGIGISGDTIVVGAKSEDGATTAVENTDGQADGGDASNDNSNSGAAYIFKL